jgi:hypothetical protein
LDKCKQGHSYTEENTYVRTDGNRECHRCRKEYQAAYRRNNRDKRRLYSQTNKDKRAASCRKWRAKNPEIAREKSRQYYQQNKEACRKRMWTYHIERTYGISAEVYMAMVEEQEFKCKICQQEKDYRLLLDHDHVTGAVRGLLCKLCNWALGSFEDEVDNLRAAIAYLEAEPTGLQVGGRARQELRSAPAIRGNQQNRDAVPET